MSDDYAHGFRACLEILAPALQGAVDRYGKPGGPWNVPGEPGEWLGMAMTALDVAARQVEDPLPVPPMPDATCPFCGQANVERVVRALCIPYRDTAQNVPETVTYRCPACEGTYLDPAQSAWLEETLARLRRETDKEKRMKRSRGDALA